MGGKAAVFIVIALVIAAALGFFVQRKLSKPELVATDSCRRLQHPPLLLPCTPAAASAEAAALKVPDVLPQFELADRDGKPRKLGDWAGRPLAVNFWATWCAPCRREIPLLNKLRQDRAGAEAGDHRHRRGLPRGRAEVRHRPRPSAIRC